MKKTFLSIYIIFLVLTFTLSAGIIDRSLSQLSRSLYNLQKMVAPSTKKPIKQKLSKRAKKAKRSSEKTVTKSQKLPYQNIGRKVLASTNTFRVRNNLSRLQWSHALAQAAFEHSKNMALRRVPFGHAGFNNRVLGLPFKIKAAAENVYMTTSSTNIATTAVKAWSHSPGHRKNLLGSFSLCGVGINKSGRKWYITQIFAEV